MFKNKKKYFLLLSSIFLFIFCFNTSKIQNDDERFKIILKYLRTYLSNMHFKPQELNDEFSTKVFNNYLETLDIGKRFFLKEDIERFKVYETKLDDSFKEPDLEFFNLSIDVLFKRLDDLSLISDKLVNNIEIIKDETIITDIKKIEYARNKAEWEEKWRKYVKNLVIQELYSLSTSNENKNQKETALLIKAKENVKENLHDLVRRIKKRTKKDLFSAYANAYTEVYDPHTTYFSPKDKEDFDVNISGQLEGIGARLEDKKGIATISELIIGGPAWKSKQLEAGDKILKVAQGNNEPVDIVGMLLDESVRLIRGKKGSKVVLTVKKKDNTLKKIPIVRDVVEYGETFAKSAVIIDEKGNKFGIINLPEFYFDIKNNGSRNSSTDIEKEIAYLKKEKIKGLVFDVRNNGGGSLSEAVNIVGAFIKEGPVVQVKEGNGKVVILNDSNSKISWDGPMVVLTNEFSASASEILAAALQDYKRAVIIGSKKTFGKGTVQSLRELTGFFDLSDVQNGDLKLTTQKFYRVNGGSTQLNGVNSDLIIPTDFTYSDISESNEDNALEWDKIGEAGNYGWQNQVNLTRIKKLSENRISADKYFKIMDEKAKWIKQISDKKEMPLAYLKYKKLIKENEAKNKQYDNLLKYKNQLIFSTKKIEVLDKEQAKSLLAKQEEWFKKLKADFTLNEAVSVLKDLK